MELLKAFQIDQNISKLLRTYFRLIKVRSFMDNLTTVLRK